MILAANNLLVTGVCSSVKQMLTYAQDSSLPWESVCFKGATRGQDCPWSPETWSIAQGCTWGPWDLKEEFRVDCTCCDAGAKLLTKKNGEPHVVTRQDTTIYVIYWKRWTPIRENMCPLFRFNKGGQKNPWKTICIPKIATLSESLTICKGEPQLGLHIKFDS